MSEEFFWLIERADPLSPGRPLPGNFLGVVGAWDGSRGDGAFRWLNTAHSALQFRRKQDAGLFLGAMLSLQEGLTFRETLPGLRPNDPRPLVCEHSMLSQGSQK